ncbi:hypothetical protein P2318_25110 [Myxococcaceae bacterium GXIMD 01537]
MGRNTLNGHYEGLDLTGEGTDSVFSILFYLNTKLTEYALPLIGVGAVEAWQIEAAHRDRYRDRIGTMGVWIGFTELHRLGLEFAFGFSIVFFTQGHWRRVDLGDRNGQLIISNPVLQWTGAHYQLAVLSAPLASGLYDVTSVVETNPHGDCALESFLLLILRSSSYGRVLGGPRAARKRDIVFRFRDAAERRRRGALIERNDMDYVAAIGGIRTLLADPAVMIDSAVNDAIVAEGQLPGIEESPSSDKSVTSSDAPTLQQLFERLDSAFADILITHAITHHNPADVICFVVYDASGAEQRAAIARAAEDDHDFAMEGCSHSGACEHSVSGGDGEVLLLSAALTKVLADNQDNVQVVLCGPYGACNGCKDRIARFVALWQAGSTQARSLIIHYLYVDVLNQTRGKERIKTTYGHGDDPYAKVSGKKAEAVMRLHTWGPVKGSKS